MWVSCLCALFVRGCPWLLCVCVCVWGREKGSLAHAWLLGYLQDKYLADMDDLFSQVDEKRKVSWPFSRAHR